MGWYEWRGEQLILKLRVQPRSSRDGFAEVMGEQRKLRITAPPVDGKANSHLIAYLAKQFGVARSAVTLLSGESGRQKRVAIHAPRQLPPDIERQT